MTLAGCTRRLSLFDCAGIVIVTTLGTCIGFLDAFITDARLNPIEGSVVALSIGPVCGILLYVWDRLANVLARELPKWFLRLGRTMRAAR